MRYSCFFGVLTLVVVLTGSVAFADQPLPEGVSDLGHGVQKAEFCERCHGVKGFTSNANMPRLAGQNKGYLIKQLKNFRKGIRKSTPMRQVTMTLTDDDIEALATYFSSVEVMLKP